MIVPCQSIGFHSPNRTLIIRIYDFEVLNYNKVKNLTDYFIERFIELPIDFVELIIKVVSIYPGSIQVVYGLRLGQRLVATNSMLMASDDVIISLKTVLKFFLNNMDRFRSVFNEYESEISDIDVGNNPLGSENDPIDVNQILADFIKS